jgi:hypothetical protein
MADSMPYEHISERLDAVLADLPEDAWTIEHDANAEWRVCRITIDWRRVPGELGSSLQKAGKLRLVPEDGTR